MRRLESKVNQQCWRGSGKKTSQHDQQNTFQAWVFWQMKSVIAVRSPSMQTEVGQHPAGVASTHIAWVVSWLWSLCETDPSFKGPLGWDVTPNGFCHLAQPTLSHQSPNMDSSKQVLLICWFTYLGTLEVLHQMLTNHSYGSSHWPLWLHFVLL